MIKKIIEYIRGKGPGGEAIRYLFAGGLTTLVNFCLFALFRLLGIGLTISNITAIAISILFAYVINKLFVFRRRSDSIAALALELFKFVGARLFTMALEVGAVELFVTALGQNEFIGKAVAQVLVIIANYFISKLIVFRKL